MDFLHYLDSVDKQWLLALNNDYAPFWNNLMVIISSKLVWIPLYLSLIFVIIKDWEKKSWIVILGLILAVVIADQVASGLLKNLVHRLRPTHDPDIENMVVIIDGIRGGLYGFVSSHAATTFSLATLSSLLFKQKIYTFSIFFWSSLVAYSRIFLGVHYPGDVLGGIIVGVLSALLIYWILGKIKYISLEKNIDKNMSFIPISVLLLTIFGMIIYSFAV